MRSHLIYEPLDRVWVKMDGYDWWPGRIVSDDELQANGQSRPEACDITVYFYEGTTTPATLEHFQSAVTNITFFETSSEKAVTADADRLAAIRRAVADEAANPLKFEFTTGERGGVNKHVDNMSTAAAGGGGVSSTYAAAAERRGGESTAHPRRSVNKRGRDLDLEDGNNFSNALQLLPDEKLVDIAQRINAAIAASDLPSLRIELCDLDSVNVTLRQLEKTKIGVAVGNILGQKDMIKLWPLARAIISSWARAMPVETLEVIKRYQQFRVRKERNDINKIHTMECNVESPVEFSGSSFTKVGNTISVPLSHAAEEAERVHRRFVDRVRKLLENPEDPPIPNLTSTDFDVIAEELCRDVVELEDRKYLQEQLEKPGMTQLRRDLATRVLNGKEFLHLPRSALLTEEEKRIDEDRITKIIDDQDKLKLVNVAITSLFKCPNCEKSRCSFYEQQTRSADEPTTKFLTCLECKYSWTTE